MIENYSMSWDASNPYKGSEEGMGAGIGSNKFTVIAFPRDTRPGFLNTFAVTDDQVVRVYNPGSTASPNLWDSVTSWDPIL